MNPFTDAFTPKKTWLATTRQLWQEQGIFIIEIVFACHKTWPWNCCKMTERKSLYCLLHKLFAAASVLSILRHELMFHISTKIIYKFSFHQMWKLAKVKINSQGSLFLGILFIILPFIGTLFSFDILVFLRKIIYSLDNLHCLFLGLFWSF